MSEKQIELANGSTITLCKSAYTSRPNKLPIFSISTNEFSICFTSARLDSDGEKLWLDYDETFGIASINHLQIFVAIDSYIGVESSGYEYEEEV
jgi:hypothetical protein